MKAGDDRKRRSKDKASNLMKLKESKKVKIKEAHFEYIYLFIFNL